MPRCEFRLIGDDSVIGTKELEALPEVDDEVTVEGLTYRVDALQDDTSNEPVVVYVRKPSGI